MVRKSIVTVVSVICLVISMCSTPLQAHAFSVDPNSVQDLRKDKSSDFTEFVTSSTPKMYLFNTQEMKVTGIRDLTSEEARDFEVHSVKHPGELILDNGHDLVIGGESVDFRNVEDLRPDKTVSFRDFMNSDVEKTFYFDAVAKTITGVSDAKSANSRSVSTGCVDADACMFGSQNYGVRGFGDNIGRWSITEYRQYKNHGQFTVDDGTSAGYTLAGFEAGDGVIFDQFVPVIEVTIL